MSIINSINLLVTDNEINSPKNVKFKEIKNFLRKNIDTLYVLFFSVLIM